MSAPALSVSSRAAFAGASWFGVRPSHHAPSGWVGVCVFAAARAARRFAACAAVAFSLPFCAVRRRAAGWFVSVPVLPPCPPAGAAVGVSVLPVSWVSLSAPSPLPLAVSSLVSAAPFVGFSGSRSVAPPPALVSALAPLVSEAAVGCARGADAAFRAALPAAVVVRVGVSRSRGAFAARSAGFVSLVAESGGCLVSFPAAPCPAGLVPSARASRCFAGFGSGSWAGVALALGLGVPCAVFLPAGVVPPALWPLRSVGAGWWVG